MIDLGKTDFLGFSTELFPVEVGKNIYMTKFPYECEYVLNSDVKTKIDREGISPQGAVNCIRASIKFKASNKNNRIGLATRNTYESHKEIYSPHYLCYEDIINEPVNHAEKPYDLLKLLGGKLTTKGMSDFVKLEVTDLIECKVILKCNTQMQGGFESKEANELLQYLQKKGFIKFGEGVGDVYSAISITVDGWAWLGEPKNNPTNKVFIAMPFSLSSDLEKLNYDPEKIKIAIQKACKTLGYEADIVQSKENPSEYITNKIIANIKESKFVVADMTGNNLGAYYEAGFAKGQGKTVIHLAHEDYLDKLHFDTRQIGCLLWKAPEDIERDLPNWIKDIIN